MTDTAPPLDSAAIRADFPILNRPLPNGKPLVYLDTGASAQKPRQVIKAIVECYETYYSNVHRGKSTLGRKVTDAVEAAREKVRALINADSTDEIIFTAGSTMSLNLVALGWGRAFVKPGDEILTSPLEHHANLVPWQMLAQATGATLTFLPLTADGRLDMSRLPEVLSKRTKLVAVSALSNVLGTVLPIAELTAAAHAVGANIVVDGAPERTASADRCAGAGGRFSRVLGAQALRPQRRRRAVRSAETAGIDATCLWRREHDSACGARAQQLRSAAREVRGRNARHCGDDRSGSRG